MNAEQTLVDKKMSSILYYIWNTSYDEFRDDLYRGHVDLYVDEKFVMARDNFIHYYMSLDDKHKANLMAVAFKKFPQN